MYRGARLDGLCGDSVQPALFRRQVLGQGDILSSQECHMACGASAFKDLLEPRRLSLDSVQKNGKQNSCSGPLPGPQLDTEGGPEHESPTFAPSFLGDIRDPETWEKQRILKEPIGFGASCTLLHLCRASLSPGMSQLQPVSPAPCLASGFPSDPGTTLQRGRVHCLWTDLCVWVCVCGGVGGRVLPPQGSVPISDLVCIPHFRPV